MFIVYEGQGEYIFSDEGLIKNARKNKITFNIFYTYTLQQYNMSIQCTVNKCTITWCGSNFVAHTG